MRLWHIDILEYLPKSQLLAQWRELNSIYKKQDRHILINYVYDYDKKYLYMYSQKLLGVFIKRNYKVKSFDNFNNYFADTKERLSKEFLQRGFGKSLKHYRFKEHNKEYLKICYYNLKEKYLRGQKDFTKDIFDKLDDYVWKETNGRI